MRSRHACPARARAAQSRRWFTRGRWLGSRARRTLAVAVSRTLRGPYTTIAHDIAPGSSAEGPSVVRRARDEILIYYDRYEVGRYGAVRAPSMRGPWTDASGELSLPGGVRHATVFRAPKAFLNRLRASYGTRERGAWRPEGVVLKPGQVLKPGHQGS